MLAVDTKGIENIQFPAVSICRPLSWTWPGLVSLIHEADSSGMLVKQNISEGRTSILGTFFQKKTEPCKTMVKDFPSFTEEFVNRFDPNQLKGLLFMYYGFNRISSLNSNLQSNCFTMRTPMKPLQNLYLSKRISPHIDLTNTTYILQQVCKSWWYCKEYHVQIVKEWFETDFEAEEVAKGNCSSIQSQDNNTLVMKWCKSCWNPRRQCTYCLSHSRFANGVTDNVADICLFETNVLSNWHYTDIFMSYTLAQTVNTPTSSAAAIKVFFENVHSNLDYDFIYLWKHLNEPFLHDDLKKIATINNKTGPFGNNVHNQQLILDKFKNPKVHGNYKNEYVLIPLCSFGTGNLTKCSLFEEVESFYYRDQICYTFNAQGNYQGKTIAPDMGLNFAINFRLPRTGVLQAATLVIHPAGVVPDMNHYSSSSFKIATGTQYHVGVEATMTNISANFEDLGEENRNCFLNSKGHMDYKRINCRMQKSLIEAEKECQCLPWFLVKSEKNTTICDPEGFRCFDDKMKSSPVIEDCPRECIFSRFITKKEDLKITTKEMFDIVMSSYGSEWKQYFADDNPVYYAEGFHHYGDPLWARTSLIHVNFGTPDATIITKDARMTFADMIGNIGGTFGVFLGLSFVGILDFLLVLCQWFKKLCRNP